MSDIDELESSGWGDRPAGEEKDRARGTISGGYRTWNRLD